MKIIYRVNMNRDIKFRAWNDITKCMIPHDNLEVGLKNINKKGRCYNSNLHFMQYIGRNDKKGKEIYEGDICKSIKHLFLVEFNSGCFKLTSINGKKCYWTPSNSASVEIIGNVYGNPELINQ